MNRAAYPARRIRRHPVSGRYGIRRRHRSVGVRHQGLPARLAHAQLALTSDAALPAGSSGRWLWRRGRSLRRRLSRSRSSRWIVPLAPHHSEPLPALQASRPSSTGLAKSTPSRPHRSTAARAGSRRGPAERTAKATSTVPKLAAVGAGGGVSATVQYVAPTGPSSTPTSASPPPAETTPAPKEGSPTASASREFGFER